MCGLHTSFHSSVASYPTLPNPSYILLSIVNTFTTLARDGSSKYESVLVIAQKQRATPLELTLYFINQRVLMYGSSFFYCPAHQVPWKNRKPYNKKRHPLRCAFTSISGFLSSQAVSSQVLSAFMSLTTVFEMGTGGSS